LRLFSKPLWPLIAASVATIPACDDSKGDGTVVIAVYGESFIEDGIPAADLADGWAVQFETFKVTVAEVTVGGTVVIPTATVDLVPASNGAGHVIGQAAVGEGSYDASSFVVRDLQIKGEATREGVVKRFDWTFAGATRFSACETTTQVKADGEATFQVTIHADHLLVDSLVSEEPNLIFQHFADADGNSDGIITQTELEATDIGALDPGSGGDIDNLWQWLVASQRTVGHVDGEGHCAAEALTP